MKFDGCAVEKSTSNFCFYVFDFDNLNFIYGTVRAYFYSANMLAFFNNVIFLNN
jgi:hypothetical protein